MRPRFRVAISPDDVGRRVTVRYRIDREGDGPGHSDAVGTLLSWQDGWLRIENRHGDVVHVRERGLVAGKVVPPQPPRRKSRT